MSPYYTIEKEVLQDMIEDFPAAFDGPECPDCGRPMVGSKTQDGPFCVWGCHP